MDDFSKRPRFKHSVLHNWFAGVFLICCLLAFVLPSSLSVITFFVAVLSWLVVFFTESRTRRQHEQAFEEYRERNVNQYPQVFDDPPPQNLEEIRGELVDLYDMETGLYIGRGLKQDIQTLYEAFDNDPMIFENGSNDIPITQDFIEQIGEMNGFELTPHFLGLLNNAMDDKYLTLLTIRWIAPSIA